MRERSVHIAFLSYFLSLCERCSMEFWLWVSLKECYYLYLKHFFALFFVSLLMSFSELILLSLFHHGYIFFRSRNFLSFALLACTKFLFLGIIMYFHHSLICGSKNLLIDKKRFFFKRNFFHAINQCLRGILLKISTIFILSVPATIYFLTVRYVKSPVPKLMLSTFLLFVILGFGHNYKMIQVSCVLESKKISHLKMSMALIRNQYKFSLVYSLFICYWPMIAFHFWIVAEDGCPHICGCSHFVQIITVLWTVFRPFSILLQVKFYIDLRKKLFPVPEMEPELMDQNLI